jgi:hypothetical protein
MLLTPKLAAAGLASTLLLTGCSVNAPVGPFDIHDNIVNNPSVTVPEGSLDDGFSIPDPIQPIDPNAPQDIPDSWSEDSVDEPDDVIIPEPIG